MKLSECRALITGASGGIGHALVDALCAGGAQLVLAGRDSSALQALAARYPQQIQIVCGDLRTPAGLDAVVMAAQQLQGLNCLINAAGVNHFSLLEHEDDATIAQMIALNVTAPLQLTRRMLPLLRAAQPALVVNLGSTFGSIGYPGYAAYCASKFALRGFSEALRRELADSAVRVLYVAPRATRTDMNTASVVAMNSALKVRSDAPATVAREIACAIRREHEERYLGWPEKLFVRLNTVLPRLIDLALRRQLPTVKHFARPAPQSAAAHAPSLAHPTNQP